MTSLYLTKTCYGLIPGDPETLLYISRMDLGQVIRGDFKKIRNYEFHKKFFAMLQVGFDAWESPNLEYKGEQVQKNFKMFRKDVTVLAGYYQPVTNIKGEISLEADSISFAKMDAEEFEKLYSDVANVLLEKVLKNYTRYDLNRVVQEILNFT